MKIYNRKGKLVKTEPLGFHNCGKKPKPRKTVWMKSAYLWALVNEKNGKPFGTWRHKKAIPDLYFTREDARKAQRERPELRVAKLYIVEINQKS